MESFDISREKFLALLKEGKFTEAEQFYWSEMFEYAEKKFLEENKVDTQYDWLIMPGGFLPEYHVFIIHTLKPKNVYFIGTYEFKEKHLDKIIQKSGLNPSQYIVDVLEYREMNLTDVYDKIRNRLNLFVGKKVILDLSRGKRIMSVGAGMVGAFFGFDLFYIDKEWDTNLRRGIPGTEKIVMVKNPFEVFGDLELREARKFLNHHNYGAALSLYKRIRQKIVDPRHIEIEELLSEAYLHWNSFNFKGAHFKLQQALTRSEQYNMKLSKELIDNKKALEVLDVKEVNNPLTKGDEFNMHLIIDLYVNALRKAEVGMFEDAISRLYRTIELISQHRLHSYQIETVGADLSRYDSDYRDIAKKIYGFEKPVPFEI